ncbi:unnamed protein product [Rangifer tarandus platyrhynchus]|uniref:Uncharacterized protein n=1 Tax=Rangifer tarandus platyrhynchus TaxID=3082113 RepID=A0ABN9A8A8_RANTA|nr:unnamed protein product [Rangifer tarandus platyrhynchus]
MVRLPLSEGPYLTEGAHTPKGHSCPGDLGLGAKDVSISDLHGEEGLKPKRVRPGLGPQTPPTHPSPGLNEGNPGGVAPGLSRDEPPHPQPVPIPSLPKSIHPFQSLTPWVTILIVEPSDCSSPYSGSPNPATLAPCWRKSRN